MIGKEKILQQRPDSFVPMHAFAALELYSTMPRETGNEANRV